MKSFVSKYLVLPIVHAVQKQPVRKIIIDLERTERISRTELDSYIASKFAASIQDAYTNAPYYSAILDNVGLSPDEFTTFSALEKIPLLTRESYIKHRKRMTIPARRVVMASTSGTSGQSIYIPRSSGDRAYNSALKYRQLSWFGIGTGAKEIRLWRRVDDVSDDWPGQMAQTLRDALLNIKRISPLKFSADKMDATIKALRSRDTKFLRGYSQALYQLAEYAISRGFAGDFPFLNVTILTGESITAFQKGRIAAAFGCPVAEEYGANECGIIALECPEGSMHIQEENVIVEVLNKGKPAAEGANGKIVITTLGNRAVPFIRYALGDIGAISSQPCPCGMPHKVLQSLQGREFPYVALPGGGAIHLVGFFVFGVIRTLPDSQTKIRSFQFVHIEPSVLELRIDAVNADFDSIKKEIQISLDAFTGGKLRIVLKNTQEMKKDPRGKQPLYMPLPVSRP